LLGLDIDQVHVEIGDSDLPFGPYSGGSGMATSLSGAIHDAVGKLVRAFLDVVADDELSPLRGRSQDEVTCTKGGIHVVDASLDRSRRTSTYSPGTDYRR
jgi:xanthine dehydrogenase YagR molybdenum-binding subunit